MKDVLGTYRRAPFENDWHEGTISAEGGLHWRNKAGVRWSLTDDLTDGRLVTGGDNPFYGTTSDGDFILLIDRTLLGMPLPQGHSPVVGFTFNRDTYFRLKAQSKRRSEPAGTPHGRVEWSVPGREM